MEPDYKAFAFAVLDADCRYCGDWEGVDLQDLAIKYGIFVKVPYDPDVHGPNGSDAEVGEPWLVFTEKK